ncbi:MAG: ATP-binding protein [Fusobacteriaceae bacterium]|nr:ATP-binding protein [Fusobacteriaceae bacterium]
MIKKFKITGLFGFRNVDINFENNVKILIGENGFGKTTVLNSLYYLLNKKYTKLSNIEFETMELNFQNEEKIQFTKFELESYINYIESNNNNRRMPLSVLKHLETLDLSEFINNDDIHEEKIIDFIKNSEIRHFAPMQIMVREISKYIKDYPSFDVFDRLEKIRNTLNFSILYLPTYRRVEEDLKNLGSFKERIIHRNDGRSYYRELEEDLEVTDDTLIHFGMEDVRKKIITVEQEIEKSTITGFSKLTGQMLSLFLNGFRKIQDSEIEELDENTIKIILHRVGDNIPQKDKDGILKLLKDKAKLKEKKDLVSFIFKLIDIYNEHKHLDDKIKNFRDVCNEYLVDKQFRYDESSVDLDIYRNGTDEKVEINKLSSGEKQIISIFSKIYLEKTENLIVLFDEPELSLSLPWQKRLLPDIMNSEKCKFLLAVTHSPFIFQNKLESHAVGINMYMDDINE